jgi:hypothetical protein
MKIEKIDFEDFMTNNRNPTLNRLADQLVNDPSFRLMVNVSRHYGKPFAQCTEEEIKEFEDSQ